MNKIYTTVWCESRQQWVVTSELARSSGRPKLVPKKSALALLLGAMLLPSGPAMAADYVGETLTNSTQHISSGDTATSTTINSGGRQNVSNGGTATSTTINSGGMHYVYSGGTATDTTIQAGGSQDIDGGTVTSTTIIDGGAQFIFSGGIATSTTLGEGWQVIYRDSIAAETIIGNGGEQSVEGGTATDATINSGGKQSISSGIAIDTTINSGGTQNVSSGGAATDTTINGGGTQNITSGGMATSTTINGTGHLSNAGNQNIYSGGTAISTIINNYGTQSVTNGGTAFDTTLNSGGVQNVYSGGAVTSSTLENGGNQNIDRGGSAFDTTINSGGIQYVLSGGITTDTTINGGISLMTAEALADGKTQINVGGELQMYAGSVATDVNITEGTLSIGDLGSFDSDFAPVQIDKLAMDGGNVSFLRYSNDSGGDFAALNISELSGSGNFLFNTSLADRNANFVTIAQGTGNFGIGVADSGKEITDHTDLTVNLIHDQGGEIDFEMVTASGRSTRAIDGGTYMYTLFSQQGKDGLNDGNVWYLGALTDEPGEGGDGGNGEKPITTPATDAVLAMATAGLNVMRSELDSLRVYRNSQGSDRKQGDGNVWGHYLGKKSAIDNSNGAAYKLHQNGFELGGDIVTGFDTGHLVTGGFVTLSNNQVNHERGGKSKIDSYGLGAYATWYDNSGFYVDGVLKANRLENNLNARMTNGDSTSGKWHQYGISTALEGGFTFKPMDNMTIEPFVRTTATHINNANVTLSNGMKAETGKARSLTAEAGTRLGTQFELGSTQFAPYLSASVEQEFAKSNTTLINGINSFDNNLNGTSGKYAAGLSAQLTKGTTVYGEMSYRQGSHIEEPIQGVAGIRVSF